MTLDDLELFDDEFAREERAVLRRSRAATAEPGPKVEDLTEDLPSEIEIATTYQPARFERVWLGSSIRPLYDQNLIIDVLSSVKGGKEASVYCCKAHPVTGVDLIAAKVYRPRAFRNLRNDKMYREGRPVLTAEGRQVKASDTRIMRAIGKKSDFGVQVEHTSWLQYEYTSLERLRAAGAAVPRPFGVSDNAIAMGYEGDALHPAPTLIEVSLERDEAEALFAEVFRNIRVILSLGMIHGDLSAYNILYWNGKVTLIDFPQVASIESNSNAEFMLTRDVARVCDYFSRQGVECDAAGLSRRLWREFGPRE